MKKTEIQCYKLDKEMKKEFNDLCEENLTTASHELRIFTKNRINQFKNLKQ